MTSLLSFQQRLAHVKETVKRLNPENVTARRNLCNQLDELLKEMQDEVIERLVKERVSGVVRSSRVMMN